MIIAKLTKLENAKTKNDRAYLKVEGTSEGKTIKAYSWDNADNGVMDMAFKENKFVSFETKEQGGFTNIVPKSVKTIAEQVVDIPKEEVQKRIETSTQQIQKVTPQLNEGTSRDRSMALSYAKDLCIAGKLELQGLLTEAETFYQYIIGNI